MTNAITKLLNTKCNKENTKFSIQMERNQTGPTFFIMMKNPERVAGVIFVRNNDSIKEVFIDKDLIGTIFPNDIESEVNKYRGIFINEENTILEELGNISISIS